MIELQKLIFFHFVAILCLKNSPKMSILIGSVDFLCKWESVLFVVEVTQKVLEVGFIEGLS